MTIKRRFYAATHDHRGYTVRQAYFIGGDWHVIGNVRHFDTFDETNEVARDLAAGKYPDIAPAGEWVNMR